MTVVDSNVWIFMNLESAPEREAAAAATKVQRRLGLQVNPIIVSEVFHTLRGLLGVADAADRTRRMLASRFVIYEPVTSQMVDEAINISQCHGVRINDAIVAAHALQAGTSVLTDNVKDFRRVPGLKVVSLRK